MRQRETNWNKRYLDEDIPWEEETPSYELHELIQSYGKENASILEVGCGLGTNAFYLASLGYRITATDIAEESIRRANLRKIDEGSPRFEVLDFMNGQHSDTYDLIYERGCFHSYFDDPSLRLFAQKVSNHLSAGGLWITISGNSDNPDEITGRIQNNYPRMSLRTITQAVEPFFEILEVKRGRFGEKNSFHSWVGVFKRRSFFYD